ncbi:uncharacterized protein [Physcomitrium patens]|uniref:uncharacterized protein n=1 Tax=Physcomitrium patens TaxID=3218 RepID=UPI003CCDBAF1
MSNSSGARHHWRRSLQVLHATLRFTVAGVDARRARDRAMNAAFAWRPQDAHNRIYRRDHVWPAIPEDPVLAGLENDIQDPQFLQMLPPIPGANLFDNGEDQMARDM